MRLFFSFTIIAMLCGFAPLAQAQAITELVSLRFGRLIVPGSGGMIQIDPDNNVSIGSNLVVTPPNPRRGRYRIQGGGSGTIDIAVTNTSTCDPGLSLDAFPAIWRNVDYPDIFSSPITAAPYNGNSVLRLGARISYTSDVPFGACPGSFDVEFTVY